MVSVQFSMKYDPYICPKWSVLTGHLSTTKLAPATMYQRCRFDIIFDGFFVSKWIAPQITYI